MPWRLKPGKTEQEYQAAHQRAMENEMRRRHEIQEDMARRLAEIEEVTAGELIRIFLEFYGEVSETEYEQDQALLP